MSNQLSLFFSSLSNQLVTEFSYFVPKVLSAILILILGAALAKILRKVVVKLLETMMVSKIIKNTPIDHFFQNTDLSQKIEEVLGSVVYWLMMLVVIHGSVTVLGLESVSLVLDRVLSYLPHVLSAVLVLFFGILLAGVVESLVKASIKSIDGKASRLLGKIASYLVISVSVLAAVSELGIARDFIIILFVGLIFTLSLGCGLALGLGGKEVVGQMLSRWYQKTKAELEE